MQSLENRDTESIMGIVVGWMHGFVQWLDSEDDMQTAIDSCPVDCIHWVDKEQLPVLEHVMTTLDRVSVRVIPGIRILHVWNFNQ